MENIPDMNTFVFDIEAYKNETNVQIPYAVGLMRLNKIESSLGDLLYKNDPIPEEKYNRLVNTNDFVKVFIGENCIKEINV